MPTTLQKSKKRLFIKQINTPKPFDMEPRKATPKEPFVSEEENDW